MKRLLAFSMFAMLAARSARAADDPPRVPPPLDVPVVHEGYWNRKPLRPFISTMVDIGFLYLRPRITFGIGRPFSKWIGIDINPILSLQAISAYGGLRLQSPFFDFRLGVRPFHAFERPFLEPQARYTTADLRKSDGVTAHAITFEGELSGGVPVGPGTVLLVLTASSVHGVPDGKYVYEETLRVITNPPGIYRARTGYALRFGTEGNRRVGVVAEAIYLPTRDAVVIRAGTIASFAIDDHIELIGQLLFPVWSPDSLGIAGGDFADLGIRFRWATGEGPFHL